MSTAICHRCFEITRNISISTYDIDFADHVSNIVYFRWLEDMRLQVFEEFFPLRDFIENGLLPILTKSSIEYKKAINLFDKPVGHMWIAELRPASVVFQGEILVDGTITTTASHVGVFISSETLKPVRIPKVIQEKFQQWYQK